MIAPKPCFFSVAFHPFDMQRLSRTSNKIDHCLKGNPANTYSNIFIATYDDILQLAVINLQPTLSEVWICLRTKNSELLTQSYSTVKTAYKLWNLCQPFSGLKEAELHQTIDNLSILGWQLSRFRSLFLNQVVLDPSKQISSLKWNLFLSNCFSSPPKDP